MGILTKINLTSFFKEDSETCEVGKYSWAPHQYHSRNDLGLSNLTSQSNRTLAKFGSRTSKPVLTMLCTRLYSNSRTWFLTNNIISYVLIRGLLESRLPFDPATGCALCRGCSWGSRGLQLIFKTRTHPISRSVSKLACSGPRRL